MVPEFLIFYKINEKTVIKEIVFKTVCFELLCGVLV